MYLYKYICIYISEKTGNKSKHMKMHRDEKMQGLQKMILFIEIFGKVKCLNF